VGNKKLEPAVATNGGDKNCGGRGFAPSVPRNAWLCFFPLLTLT
jgi:hypothetical protein